MTVQVRISSRADTARFLQLISAGRAIDGLLVAGFDVDGLFTGVAVNGRHRSLSWVKVWELAELATELQAHALLFGAFPAGPPRDPSLHEITAFAALSGRSQRAGMLLLDCIVFRGERWWSLLESSRSAADA